MDKQEQENLKNLARDKQFIVELREILNETKKDYDTIKDLYPERDLRPAFYGLPANIIYSLFLHASSIDDTISQPSWWQEKLGITIDVAAVKESASFSKHAYFIFFLARIESLQRKTINLVSTRFIQHKKPNYTDIYKEYLKCLSLTNYIPLFEIAVHTRNTIHTNGIFLSRDGNDVTIEWKGVSFVFKHMQSVNFMSPENLIFIMRELLLSIKEILDTETIKKIPFIEDKFH